MSQPEIRITRQGTVIQTFTDRSASEALNRGRSAARIGDTVTLITTMPTQTLYEHFDVVLNQRKQKVLRFASQETK